MNKLSEHIVESVFPEERNRLFKWLNIQKRNLKLWLFISIILALVLLLNNFQTVFSFLFFHFQTAINWIIFFWIITLAILPFIWPEKPGDVFIEDFKSGLNPKIWNWLGNWKTEIDESGKPVLSVTNSGNGGIAVPFISWSDYELNFDTRIINSCTAWIVRASSLNNFVMFQLTTERIRPHLYTLGYYFDIQEIDHQLLIKPNIWYPIRTIIRNEWAAISIKIDGKDCPLYEGRIFQTRLPAQLDITRSRLDTPDTSTTNTQVIEISYRSGTFGFRLHGDEFAQFRNIRAYKLR